ncbi:MAG TPA: hypothetical protein VF509_08045 [Sphingobium sp.]
MRNRWRRQDVDDGDACAIDPVEDQIVSVQSTANTLSLEGGGHLKPLGASAQI